MFRRSLILALFLLTACGEDGFKVANDPTSVRGWVLNVKGATRGETIEMELARRAELFVSTSVWVENVEYASGTAASCDSVVSSVSSLTAASLRPYDRAPPTPFVRLPTCQGIAATRSPSPSW